MKYVCWNWYVPESSRPLVPIGDVDFQHGLFGVLHDRWPGYKGKLNLYRCDLDRPGLGEFCDSVRGSGINAPGDGDHAGNSSHICNSQLQVNDKPKGG